MGTVGPVLEELPDSERDAAVRKVLQEGCPTDEAVNALNMLSNSPANIDLKLEYKYGKKLPIDIELDSEQLKQLAGDVQASFETTNRNVTSAGRAKIQNAADSNEIPEETPEVTLRPWLLAAVVDQAPEEYWQLVVPATLGLIDSPKIVYKVWGCWIVDLLVDKQKDRLESRGLLPVFFEAILPCLNYLPPSVPVDDALVLNRPAFRSLLALASSESQVHLALRDGPFKAIKHTGHNVEFTINVLESLQTGIRVLGPATARHFTALTRVFMSITSDPFVDLSPRLVATACATMELAMKACSSLVVDHKYDILYGLAMARALDSSCFAALQAQVQLPPDEIQTLREHVAASLG